MASTTSKRKKDEEKPLLYIDGKGYNVDNDLQLGELADLEDHMDAPLEELDFRRFSALTFFLWIIDRRKNTGGPKDVTLEHIRALNATQFLARVKRPEDDGEEDASPPAVAAE